jgi:AcrR family transcriptional regulator
MTGDAPDTGRRGRPRMTDAQRREQSLQISRHAVALFRSQGLEKTSGEQIATAAGVSERTLWRLFRSKESCVAPLLAQSVEAFQRVLRMWPAEADLADHLRFEYSYFSDASRADSEAVLAVIRMTRHEPALRAAWLVIYERAEATLTEMLKARPDRPPDDLTVHIQAAGMLAALRVGTDALAWACEREVDDVARARYRDVFSAAIQTMQRAFTGRPADEPSGAAQPADL